VKYPEYKSLEYAQIAEKVLAKWTQQRMFERSVDERAGNPAFVFFEGPPSANGTPGIHHVMARTIKDVFCRFKTMQGFQVRRKGGWDTHGLPVELQVEKELGITKDDIGKTITVEAYNQKCRETVMKFKHQWDDLTKKMGYWVDLENPYITYENNYIESCWNLLKRLHEKDLLYKGYTIQPYSPTAGTGLSSHELNQPGCYKMVKDTSIVAQFKIKRNAYSEKLFQNIGKVKAFSQKELLKSINDPNSTETVSQVNWTEVFFLAWTTTPWTLSSNAALAVGENITYVKIRTYNPYTFQPVVVILAKDLMSTFFHSKSAEIPIDAYNPGDKVIPYEVLESYTGLQLIGIEYEQLMPYVQPKEEAFRVIAGDFVSTEDGTGIVHIAPTFGADDYRVAKLAGIPAILVNDENGNPMPLVDKKGRFVPEMGDFAGMYVKNYDEKDENDPQYKSTDVLISIKLKTENKAFKVEKYEHSYPHCWRTDKPVLYYPLESWFIRTTALKDRMVELNKTIQWKPESTGTGRFGNWLENLVDWNLSRSRYWGTPLPIWRTEDGKEEICIGSIEELQKEQQKSAQILGKPMVSLQDLHRPFVDDIVLVSPSGKPMYREKDLIDVWFDSGAMPYAQWHFPFSEASKNESFVADFISEGVDQTRGWFFTLHALAVLLFDQVAFKNVVSTGLVLDKNGEKMSKRKGNVIDPFETLKQYGPDATRWYMIANAPPWDNLKFNLEGITEVQRKFFGTLHNTYNFFAIYANLDHYHPEWIDAQNNQHLAESDRWILSRLNSLIKLTTEAFNDYEPTRAARAIQDFVCDDVSNWYVRLNRKRFWKGELNPDKKAAYNTLFTCLKAVSMLMAPISPFYAEQLYSDLTKGKGAESVHLELFPKADLNCVLEDLEIQMDMAQRICSLVHSIRKNHNLRVRLPLQKILIPISQPTLQSHISKVAELICSEVNVKSLEFIRTDNQWVKKKAKPNFKKLGKTFGPLLKDAAAYIVALETEQIQILENGGSIPFVLQGNTYELIAEDVEISTEDIPGWATVSDGTLTVALDITVTETLKQEGIARDFVNRIQNLRKDKGLEVTDRILIEVLQKDPFVTEALDLNKNYICSETQANVLQIKSQIENALTIEMEDFKLEVSIYKTQS
jgi:isoleucyl-tRNA synthetase